jgi:hypothetical protein
MPRNAPVLVLPHNSRCRCDHTLGCSRPTIREALKREKKKRKRTERQIAERAEKNRPRMIEREEDRRLAEQDPTLHQVLLNEADPDEPGPSK